jgi:hypothetical protein
MRNFALFNFTLYFQEFYFSVKASSGKHRGAFGDRWNRFCVSARIYFT